MTETEEEKKIYASVSSATLESTPHAPNAIRDGIRLYEEGKVGQEVLKVEKENSFIFFVKNKGHNNMGCIGYTPDGRDIAGFSCSCSAKRGLLCKHLVAGILAMQGGMADSKISVGMTASVETSVDRTNTAGAINCGDADVFAMPMMIMLMERAASDVLRDVSEPGETSLGVDTDVRLLGPSAIGSKIRATAEITAVHGSEIIFKVSAADDFGPIGEGTHTRIIGRGEDMVEKAKERSEHDR